MKKLVIITLLLCLYGLRGKAQETEWQWRVEIPSVLSGETNAHPQAFLWIPSTCVGRNERPSAGIPMDTVYV